MVYAKCTCSCTMQVSTQERIEQNTPLVHQSRVGRKVGTMSLSVCYSRHLDWYAIDLLCLDKQSVKRVNAAKVLQHVNVPSDT